MNEGNDVSESAQGERQPMSLFQLLVSADAVVPDHDATIRRCVDEWGLPEPHQRWTQAPAGYAAKAAFARVHPDRRVGPARCEGLSVPHHEPARQGPAPGP